MFLILNQCGVCLFLCANLLLSCVNLAGFPKDGHKEEGGTVETSKREVWNQHRPSKVAFWGPLFLFSCQCKITKWTVEI